MNTARTTLGLWLLLQLLLGGLHGPAAPAPQGETLATQWRDETARHAHAGARVEAPRAQRTTTPSADDMLAGTGAPIPQPPDRQAQPASPTPGRAASPALAAYRARAPPPAT